MPRQSRQHMRRITKGASRTTSSKAGSRTTSYKAGSPKCLAAPDAADAARCVTRGAGRSSRATQGRSLPLGHFHIAKHPSLCPSTAQEPSVATTDGFGATTDGFWAGSDAGCGGYSSQGTRVGNHPSHEIRTLLLILAPSSHPRIHFRSGTVLRDHSPLALSNLRSS
jgi:hypothetical protein